MIQNISIMSVKAPKIQQRSHQTSISFGQQKADSFQKSSVPNGDLQAFDFDQLKKHAAIFTDIEAAGAPERAEKVYIEDFNKLNNHIKEKYKKTPCRDENVLLQFFSANTRVLANLSIKAALTENEEEKNATYDRIRSYIQKGKTTFQKHFDPKVFDMSSMDKYNPILEGKNIPVSRSTERGENLGKIAIERRFNAGDLAKPSELQEEFLSQKEVLEGRSQVAKKIEQLYPQNKNNYSVFASDDFKRYKDLSNLAINNSLNTLNHSNEVDLLTSRSILQETLTFLKKKDPENLYWEKDEFKLTAARINESEHRNLTKPVDAEVLDSAIAMTQKEKPSLSKQIKHLETLQKSPKDLGMVAFLLKDPKNENDVKMAKYAATLLKSSQDKKSLHQLRIMGKKHPIPSVKAFAREILSHK